MRKRRKILIILLIPVIIIAIIILSGIEKRYFYVNKEFLTENTLIEKTDNFTLELTAEPLKDNLNCFDISFFFNDITEKINVDSFNIEILNNRNPKIKLTEISAVDGFYNWVEEKNGKAENFEKLLKHLKEISKETKSYFLYNCSFNCNRIKTNNLQIRVTGKLLVANKTINLNKVVNLQIENELIYRSQIRFH